MAELTEAELTVARAHALDILDVETELRTDAGGLTTADAAARLAIAGPNRLPDPKRKPAILRFLGQTAVLPTPGQAG